jgi:hypothetical protein
MARFFVASRDAVALRVTHRLRFLHNDGLLFRFVSVFRVSDKP